MMLLKMPIVHRLAN